MSTDRSRRALMSLLLMFACTFSASFSLFITSSVNTSLSIQASPFQNAKRDHAAATPPFQCSVSLTRFVPSCFHPLQVSITVSCT